MSGLNDDLVRFVAAQDQGGTYVQALSELRRGRKESHWIWYVFPQIEGLGLSELSRRYAVASLAQARDYLTHPVLGSRLEEVSLALLAVQDRSIEEIFGPIDAQKVRSSMTLFLRASPSRGPYQDVIDVYFDGVPDAATDKLLAAGRRSP